MYRCVNLPHVLHHEDRIYGPAGPLTEVGLVRITVLSLIKLQGRSPLRVRFSTHAYDNVKVAHKELHVSHRTPRRPP